MDWIKVEDRLPEINDKTRISSQSRDVLVLDCDGTKYVGFLSFYAAGKFRKEEQYFWECRESGCGCCSEPLSPTHWMELPADPI